MIPWQIGSSLPVSALRSCIYLPYKVYSNNKLGAFESFLTSSWLLAKSSIFTWALINEDEKKTGRGPRQQCISPIHSVRLEQGSSYMRIRQRPQQYHTSQMSDVRERHILASSLLSTCLFSLSLSSHQGKKREQFGSCDRRSGGSVKSSIKFLSFNVLSPISAKSCLSAIIPSEVLVFPSEVSVAAEVLRPSPSVRVTIFCQAQTKREREKNMCLFEYDLETCPECDGSTRVNFRQPLQKVTSSPTGICAAGLAESPPAEKAETCPHRFDWHAKIDNRDRVMDQPCGACREKADLRAERLKRAREWVCNST